MDRLAPLPTVIPLVAAALAMLAHRSRWLQRTIAHLALTAALSFAVALLVHADREGPAVARLGGWSASIGISYVVDRLSGLLLVVALFTLLAVLVFAEGQRSKGAESPVFHPVYLVLAAGTGAAFSTGDLFHMFVAYEVLLIASYVLLTLDGTPAQVRTGTTYAVVNTIESLVLVMAVALVYASTGTLSMAELPARLAELNDGVRTGLQLLLLVAFGLKAAVFPLFFWLPDSYPAARSPITAVFAGLLTKVGVYSILRTQTLLFADANRTLLLWVAGLTMVVGVLGAIAQNEVKRILSFHIVSQIGYMILGIAIGGPAAIAATIFFLLHQIPIKSSLFLVEGMIEHSTGTSSLDRLSGLVHRSGLLGALFLLPALSLAGIPPFSGFVAKLGIVTSGLAAGERVAVALAIGCSLLTLVSMAKIWLGAFWGPATEPVLRPAGAAPDPSAAWRWPAAMLGSTVAVVLAGLALAVFAGPLYALCERAAADIADVDAYVRTVLRR
ncbi:MAG TPA: proton-conducting transporter membrane subunit [Ilumatobacter sp.]|nr:proton-conducting transporter membrane subunit [Ilumatobacter sp.]